MAYYETYDTAAALSTGLQAPIFPSSPPFNPDHVAHTQWLWDNSKDVKRGQGEGESFPLSTNVIGPKFPDPIVTPAPVVVCYYRNSYFHRASCRGCLGTGTIPRDSQKCFYFDSFFHSVSCTGCHGRGYIPHDVQRCFLFGDLLHGSDCLGCGGRGYIDKARQPCYFIGRLLHGTSCRACEGTGYMPYDVKPCPQATNLCHSFPWACPVCKDRGFIPQNHEPCIFMRSGYGRLVHNDSCVCCMGTGHMNTFSSIGLTSPTGSY